MTEPFTLEWMGGVAEYHFRKARPGADDFDWESLDPSRYPESLVTATQKVWTDVAMSEYAAIAAFADVVQALALAKAPLDLTGMVSDFLADEVRHVELASRIVMQLGGAAPRPFDPAKLSYKLHPNLTPFQRANELALRIGCIAEAFASATAATIMRSTTHPLIRAVDESILRDEARHRRFGTLYFEWAGERLTDAERERLGRAAVSTLTSYSSFWRRPMGKVVDGKTVLEGWRVDEIRDLGWLESASYVPMALAVVTEQIVPSLRALGLKLPEEELAALIS